MLLKMARTIDANSFLCWCVSLAHLVSAYQKTQVLILLIRILSKLIADLLNVL